MNYQGIIKTFEPLSKESSLAVIDKLKKGEKTLEQTAKAAGITIDKAEVVLDELKKAGLVSAFEREQETFFGISPFGAFGAVNMLKEILGVEQGCKGCASCGDES